MLRRRKLAAFARLSENLRSIRTTWRAHGNLRWKPLRCFRTIFAYGTNLSEGDWLTREWERVTQATSELGSDPALIDRIVVLNRGMLNPPSRQGCEDTEFLSVFHQWFIGMANFLSRENSRRPPVDWQTYQKKRAPGWRSLGALKNGSE